jgi:hypothetical protein
MLGTPSHRLRCRAVAAAVALLGSGCALHYEPTLSDHAIMPDYSPDELRALAGRAVKVEVHGNPFAIAQPAFDGQIAANMNDSAAAPAHFVAFRESSIAPRYRVVWNFSPPVTSVAPNAICQGSAEEPSKAGVPIDAYAAFCRDNEALSSVRGRLYYTDTPNSVEFLSLIDQMTAELFPKNVTGLRRSGDARLGAPVSSPRR